jgi:formylmethanofuran--tetrahydromethanopterin N-formyltransferase
MKVGIHAAATDGVIQITAGNFGGKLGKYKFHLKDLVN